MINIQNKYIVTFKDDVSKEQIEEHIKKIEEKGGVIHHRYEAVLNGFAASFPEEHFSVLSECREVEYVEPDKIVKACRK